MQDIKSMTKYELTQLYYPDCGKKRVNKFFKAEIHGNPTILAELRAVGYALFRKKLSSAMVRIIFNHLTDPRDESNSSIKVA